MTHLRIIGYCLVISFLLGGCSQRLQIEDALQDGGRQLSKREIRTTLTDATIAITSWDQLYEAEIKLYPDGRLKAKNSRGEQDKGQWKIADDGRFCLEFEEWLPDDMTCFEVVDKNEFYQLFNPSGAYSFHLQILQKGDPAALQRQKAASRSLQQEPPEDGEDKKSWYSFLLPFGDGEDTVSEVSEVQEKEAEPVRAELRHLLEDKECVSCDLSGEDLADLDLDDADLEGAILKGADLSGTDLTDSNLAGADLSGANLKKADLRDAILKRANLSGADLEMALLEDADLEDADLSNARVVDTVLDKAVLTRANLKGADLHWASLKDAELAGANLENAYLVKADFQGADLTGANLDGAVIQRTNFKGAKGYNSPEEQDGESGEEEKDSGWWIF